MDHRAFFAIGDLLANVAIGMIVGLICWVLVIPGWNMWITMFAMMALGMVAGLVFFFPVGIKLGAMEVMVPLMFSGMLSGMVVGMVAVMVPLTPMDALLDGAAAGGAGILFIWLVNQLVRGVTREGEGG